MPNNPANKRKRRTTLVPVTTMEEIPVLSEKERAELVSTLKSAQTRMKSGRGVEYNPEAFERRLLDIYRKSKR
jgi:hypothetical protein